MTELEFLSKICSLPFTLECKLVHGTNNRVYMGTESFNLFFYGVSHIHSPSYREEPGIKIVLLLTVSFSLRAFRKITKSEYQLRNVCLSARHCVRVSVHSHEATRLSLDGILLNLIFEYFFETLSKKK